MAGNPPVPIPINLNFVMDGPAWEMQAARRWDPKQKRVSAAG